MQFFSTSPRWEFPNTNLRPVVTVSSQQNVDFYSKLICSKIPSRFWWINYLKSRKKRLWRCKNARNRNRSMRHKSDGDDESVNFKCFDETFARFPRTSSHWCHIRNRIPIVIHDKSSGRIYKRYIMPVPRFDNLLSVSLFTASSTLPTEPHLTVW